MREPNPLQWPAGWPRTPADQRGRNLALSHHPTIYRAARHLVMEIRLWMPAPPGVPRARPVITSDLPLDADGMPRPGSTAADPGVAVYWTYHGVEHVIACDRWESAAANVRALGKTVSLLRQLSAWAPRALTAGILYDLAIDCDVDRHPMVAALGAHLGGF